MLETKRPVDLEEGGADSRWLIEELWSHQAVGIVGGEPKCCKSYLGLEMAVSVSSGEKCLGKFAVGERGPVLLFQAEDPEHVVRERLRGIAKAKQVSFDALSIHVITTSTLRIDEEQVQASLRATIEHHRPKLLILDPLVRLHGGSENSSSSIATLLGFLRTLQREFEVAIVLVHHMKKHSAGKLRDGQALRGSGDLHGWGDSNLYLRREKDALLLSAEHRAADSFADLPVALTNSHDGLALRAVQERVSADASTSCDGGGPKAIPLLAKPARELSEPKPTPRDRIEAVLLSADAPLSVRRIREVARMRTERVVAVLRELEREGRVEKAKDGYFMNLRPHEERRASRLQTSG